MKKKALSLLGLVLLVVACWWVSGFLWGFQGAVQNALLWVGLALACVLSFVAIVWVTRRWGAIFWIIAGLLLLPVLFIPSSTLLGIFPPSGPEPFGAPEATTLFLISSSALVVAALLLYTALAIFIERKNARTQEGSHQQTPPSGFIFVIAILLGVLLLVKSLYNLFWLIVWDNTTDSLMLFWLGIPILAAIFAGAALSVLAKGEAIWIGIGYALGVIILAIGVYALARQVDYRRLTVARAETVSKALADYQDRYGRYPESLRQIRSWGALSLPRPVIIYGQDWCYDGDADYYRLGYVNRLHWSDPRLIGQIHSTAGNLPDLPPICETEVIALQERYVGDFYSYWMEDKQ